MTEKQPRPTPAEQQELREKAFKLTQEVLRDPARLERVRAGVAEYTSNTDNEFRNIHAMLQAQKSVDVFRNADGGAPWVLWGVITYQLESGQLVTIDDLQGEKLREMIRQAYSNSAAGGV